MIYRPSRNLNVAIVLMAVEWAVLSADLTNGAMAISLSVTLKPIVATNMVKEVPDARKALPRSIPMPPMPPPPETKAATRGKAVQPWARPLPGGTNRSYSQHLEDQAKREASGRRRSE